MILASVVIYMSIMSNFTAVKPFFLKDIVPEHRIIH